MSRLALFGEEVPERYLHRLEVFKKRRKLSFRDIAKMFNVDVALVYRYCEGTRRPRLKRAKEIEEITDGFIKPKHWGYKE